MKKKQIGIALLVIGVILLGFGYNASGSLESQFSQAFSGTVSDKALLLFVAGGICSALGLFRLLR